MRNRLYLPTLIAVAMLAGPSQAAAPAASAPAPPIVIPVTAYGGDGKNADPGADADRRLFAAILVNNENTSASLARNCPGVSSTSTCQPYKYIDFLKNFCNTRITLAAYQYATRRTRKRSCMSTQDPERRATGSSGRHDPTRRGPTALPTIPTPSCG